MVWKARAKMTSELKVGDRVVADPMGAGKVAYHGETEFADGIWVGIILDEPKGKNNGTVKGKQYFQCAENCGAFVRSDRVGTVLFERKLIVPF